MISRRGFLAALPVAVYAQSGALSDRYDLVIRGGRVIDPSRRFDGLADVAIVGGRIAAVKPRITSGASDAVDAAGKLVIPGLVDIHTHAVRGKDDAALCMADGVTSLIDAGSRGSDNIDDAVSVAKAAPNRMRLDQTASSPRPALCCLRSSTRAGAAFCSTSATD